MRALRPQESTRARRRYLGYGTRVHNAQTRVMYDVRTTHYGSVYGALALASQGTRDLSRTNPARIPLSTLLLS